MNSEPKITLKKTLGHFKTVLVHKFWVFHYACKLGIFWRGLVHDNSKFSPVEFWESVRYWDGKRSPIPICKAYKGYSLAWQHHKGRNSHHYEYWVDNLDRGGKAIKMPWKDMLELVADWLGAGKAYQGKDFTLLGEATWVEHKLEIECPKIHEQTRKALLYIFWAFATDRSHLDKFKVFEPCWKERYEQDKPLAEPNYDY